VALGRPLKEPNNARTLMTPSTAEVPSGARPTSGIVNRRSPLSLGATVERLIEAISAAGAKLFVVVDHSGEAARAGLSLRDTKLLVFGNPTGGTPVMQFAPLAALDLPLKVLVWQDDAGAVWISYLSAEWLADRHGITADLAKPLSAVDALASHVAASA
jgi:uncharacterized protein (DUF302 family)